MGDLFPSHIYVARDEGTAFEIEEDAGLKRIVCSHWEKVTYYYLSRLHFLRAVPSESTESIVFVSESSGRIAIDAGGERIGHTDGFIVFGMGHERRSLNALLIDNGTKEAAHAFRESIM